MADYEDRQKQLITACDRLIGRRSRGEIWRDMVALTACTIANSVPTAPHRQERERDYLDIARKYSAEQLKAISQIIGDLWQWMDESVERDDYRDYLGDTFMKLNLGNEFGGQFFTPFHICAMMAKINSLDSVHIDIEKNGYATVTDPACGAGATLIAMAQRCRREGIDDQRNVLFIGQDIDAATAQMCYIQLSMLGCAGYVHIGNTLRAPMTADVLFGDVTSETWYTPMFFSAEWAARRALIRMKQFGRKEFHLA